MDSTQIVNLENSKTGGDLYQSHKLVTSYWSPFWDEMEVYYDNLSGEMWTPAEKALFKRKKKAPVVINDLVPAQRTILGLFIQNKYDVKFAPREQAQDISDVLQRLYAWTAYSQDWAQKDVVTVNQAWCGGVGYQEIYMKVTPGEEPVMITNNINPFSIAWDPESRDLINREDADFVDRDTWVSYHDLQELFPDKVTSLEGLETQGASGYQHGKTYADRTGECYDTKNNRYKITERYYKVRKRQWTATNAQGSKPIQDPENRAQYEQSGASIHSKSEEFLYLAIICPAWKIDQYLYNGEYHCQPRDLFSGKIIFPFVELVAESINGVPSGFVKHLVQINRLKNSAVANIFHAQKHAASTALIRKRKLFGTDEAMAQSFDKNHSDADRVFQASDQADLSSDIIAVPKGFVSQDSDKVLEIADVAFDKVSAASPALQGQQESSSVSGILNSQRIEQSAIQLQPFVANVKHFLKRRAELAYYYWREYYTYPMKVRIIGDQGAQAAQAPGPQMQGQPGQPPVQPPTHVEINQEQPVMDWQGNATGAIEKINDINVARYDVDVEDSFQSPTYRAKVLQQLTDVMQRPGVDPGLMDILFLEFAKSTDMAQTTKDSIKQYIQSKQEAAQQPPQTPPPEPIRVSMSVKSEDLSNPAMISMLVATKVITPEEAQMMMQQAPQGPAQDPKLMQEHQGALAENQSLKQQLESRAQEAALKQQQLQLETARFQHEADLSTQQHQLETAKFEHEIAVKADDQEMAKQGMLLQHTGDETGEMGAPVEDSSIAVAHIKAQTEIEKARINADAHMQTARMSHDATSKAGQAKPGKAMHEDGETMGQDYSVAIAKLQDGQQSIETILADITKKMGATKHITVHRDAQNKITGATATIEGGA